MKISIECLNMLNKPEKTVIKAATFFLSVDDSRKKML